MPRVLRHDVSHRTPNDWAIAIPAGLVIAGLLGFVAFFPMRTLQVANAGKTETVGLGSREGGANHRSKEAGPGTKRPLKTGSAIARQTNLPSELVGAESTGRVSRGPVSAESTPCCP